jgi:serine/threonine protein kinase/WD40 repeat protein
MNASMSGDYEQLDQIAEEFADRFRRGERPSLQEYTQRYPALAEEIRELFPAMVEIERAEVRTEPATLPLRQVGDYRILREIGRGGMGVVYEAEQASLGRRVALKVLHAGGDAKALERFKREARAAAKLHHTNIVPVFEVGVCGVVSFYAMQYIQGQGLDLVIAELRRLRSPGEQCSQSTKTANDATCALPAEVLARSMLTEAFAAPDVRAATLATAEPSLAPLTEADQAGVTSSAVLPGHTELSKADKHHRHLFESIARIGQQTAGALAHAHERGVVHRDIKPSNLLLDASGTVWVTDFGLAKTEEGDLTNPGDILGTLRYMSPERFQGRCDIRADIYALGITLYELLVLRPAFQSSDRAALISEITTSEPARPRSFDQRIPRDLETIVLKAIARDPARRYQTATDMTEDLRRFLAGEPIKARRTSLFERTRLWCRRHKALAGLYLVLFLVAIGSSLAAFYLNHLLEESEANRNKIANAEADRTEKLYQSLVAQANASRFSHRVGQRFGTLETVRKAAELVRERQMASERLNDLRALAIAALTLPDFRTLRSWEGRPPGSGVFVADDQLRLYARREPTGFVSLRQIDTDKEIARLSTPRPAEWLRFSPGGRFLAADENYRQLRVWDLSAAPPRVVIESDSQACVFHPDGRHMLIADKDGSFRLHDLEASPQDPPPAVAFLGSAESLEYAPQGDRLAAFKGGKLRLLDAKTGKMLGTLPEAQPVRQVAWHPGGNFLAVVCSEHDIHVWDLQRMTRVADLKGCRNAGMNLAFTPDGTRLLTTGFEGLVRLWDWRTGRQVLQRPGSSDLQVRSDGRLLILVGTQLELVELATGREYRSFVQHSQLGKDVSYWSVAVHPQGRFAAVAMSDFTRLFDLATGDEVGRLHRGGKTLAFDAQGALLTNGPFGLLRWPIRPNADLDQWQVGPPETLLAGAYVDMASDRKGEVIGQATRAGAILVRTGKSPMFLGPHADARHISISPDGKYAATGNHGGEAGVMIWDIETGKLLVHLPLGANCGVVFSPDGNWLAVAGTRGHRVLKVGTWEQCTVDSYLDGRAYLLDGSVWATTQGQGVIRFLEPSNGREIARLEDPDEALAGSIAFTPDGATMVVSGDFDHALHVWDLRAIRKQLAEMGLDWNAGSNRSLAEPPEAPRSMQSLPVRVDLGTLLTNSTPNGMVADARAHAEAGQHAEALALLRQATKTYPKHATAHNNLAWLLLTGPEKFRNAKEALPHAQQADILSGGRAIYKNTLGVALYRNGKYKDAVSVLEKSLESSQGSQDAFDLFFLAMCHHELGDAAKAKECHDRAGRWFEERRGKLQASWIDELTAFQAEAKAVLDREAPPNKAKSP